MSYSRDPNAKDVEALYDLNADIGETTNLAELNPGKVAELRKLVEQKKKRKSKTKNM